MRAETYVNLYSLSVGHFNDVLDRYPVMRRTMESVAAERLTKIGQNPSIVSSRADLEEDQKLVNELVMESTPVVTSASEDEDKDSDDSSESSKSSRRKKKFKFDFTGKLHKITEERKSKSRESLKDAIDGDAKSRMRKAPSGSNLFGLRVPKLQLKHRSGSVGANLNSLASVQESSLESCRRPSFLNTKFFKSGKSREKTRSTGDDSLSSEGPGSLKQYLNVPMYCKSKSKSIEDSLSSVCDNVSANETKLTPAKSNIPSTVASSTGLSTVHFNLDDTVLEQTNEQLPSSPKASTSKNILTENKNPSPPPKPDHLAIDIEDCDTISDNSFL